MDFNVASNTNEKFRFYNPDDVIAIVQKGLNEIITSDSFYNGYSFKMSNEQYYIPDEERKFGKNTIFVVIKMMKATLDFNQIIVPFTLTALSEQNNIAVCQKLFLEYAQTFNLTDGNGRTALADENDQNSYTTFMYKQSYDTPVYTSHFNEVYDGYRSVLTLTGNILINYDVYPIKKVIYYPSGFSSNNYYEIKTLANAFGYSNTLDTQPYSGKNRTESISKFGTLTLSFTIYSQKTSFVYTLMRMALQNKDRGSGQVLVNTEFHFGLVFAGDFNNDQADDEYRVTVKLNDLNFSQAIGQFPTINVSFTE